MLTYKDKKVHEVNCNELVQILSYDDNAKLVDVLDRLNYAKEHIKGAVSLPIRVVKERAKKLFGKGDTIITYSSNCKCPASTDAARILLSLGYTYVLDYKGGLVDYKKADLPLEGSLYTTKQVSNV